MKSRIKLKHLTPMDLRFIEECANNDANVFRKGGGVDIEEDEDENAELPWKILALNTTDGELKCIARFLTKTDAEGVYRMAEILQRIYKELKA